MGDDRAGDADRPRTRWGRVLAANLVGVGILLALLEIGTRLLRPDVGPAGSDLSLLQDRAFQDADGFTTALRPGAVGQANGATVRVDAQGYHVYAGNAGLADSAAVWLWLGDSVTFGIGVPADSTLAGRLALAQDTARVLNPSLLGWGTVDYRRRLEAALADGLRPARVTLVWCLNDADPGRPSRPGEVGRLEVTRRDLVRRLNLHSRLYRLLKGVALDRPARYFAYDRQWYEPLRTPRADRAPAPIDTALDPLWTIRDTLAARGIPFEVVVVPYEPQLRAGDAMPQRALVPRLRQRGIPTLDLLDAFRRVDRPERLFLWSDGIHLSEAGHAVAAGAIARWRPPGRPPGRPPALEVPPDPR